MTDEDGYCGFLCSDIIERQQAIINDIKDFSQYNREFAMVMIGKIIEMSYNAGLDLPVKKVNPTSAAVHSLSP